MNPSLKSLALATTALALAQGVVAAAPADCTVKARSETVVLMHCKANLDDKILAKAAKAACEPGKTCNVWIWDDLSKMPAAAPKTDTELPKTATGAAVAVWINDSASLMTLKKTR